MATRINLHNVDVPDFVPEPGLSATPVRLVTDLLDACSPRPASTADPRPSGPRTFPSQLFVGNRAEVFSTVTLGERAALLARAAVIGSLTTTTCLGRGVTAASHRDGAPASGYRIKATRTTDLVHGIGEVGFAQTLTVTPAARTIRVTLAGAVVGRALLTVVYFSAPAQCLNGVTKSGAVDPHTCATPQDSVDPPVLRLVTVMAQRARTG